MIRKFFRKLDRTFTGAFEFVMNTAYYYTDRGYTLRQSLDLARKTMP
jgi:hypothetical protein